MRTLTVVAALIALPAAAHAQQAVPYLDDRSNPTSLIGSLYNAINRGEFARAYSYFSVPPAADVATYAAGYADTETVEVLTGGFAEEGAAGSTYYQVPVALQATAADGGQTVFSGCYTLRLADPAVQGDAFSPMSIERGALRVSQSAFEDAVPRQCGDGPDLPAYDAVLERAKAIHAALAGPDCERDPAAVWGEDFEPDSYSLRFRYEYESEEDPEREMRLLRFFCYRGAYNEMHVYYLADEYGDVRQLQFARPELAIRYEDDDFEKAVESIRIDGFGARAPLVNSSFDADTQTIEELSMWRGMGDASSTGRWAFRQGQFRLVHFEVDASYDGEQDLETILDYETAP